MAAKCATLMIIAIKLTEAPKEAKEVLKCCRVTQKEVQRFFKKIASVVPRAAVLGTSSAKYVE